MSPGTPLPDSANCLRRVRSSEINASGRVKKSAFLPRKEGKDSDGLSVSIQDDRFASVHRQKFEGAGYRVCQILVSSVRQSPPLDVKIAPEPQDPMHALIVGFPDRALEIARAERLADELSRRAKPYTFPEPC